MKIVPTAERYKKASENLDYDFDFTELLGSDILLSAVVSSVPSGLTLGVKMVTSTIVKQYVSGGVVGTIYTVTCQMTSVSGRVKGLDLLLTIIA